LLLPAVYIAYKECCTHALEINPNPVINSGANPTTNSTSAMMYVLMLFGKVIVAICAAEPMRRMRQKIARGSHPEARLKPWRKRRAKERRKSGE